MQSSQNHYFLLQERIYNMLVLCTSFGEREQEDKAYIIIFNSLIISGNKLYRQQTSMLS